MVVKWVILFLFPLVIFTSCTKTPEEYLFEFNIRLINLIKDTEISLLTHELKKFWDREKPGVQYAIETLQKKLEGTPWYEMESAMHELQYYKNLLQMFFFSV